MATITITTVNGTQTTRVSNAICTRYGYTGFEIDGITPLTQLEFVRRQIIKWVKSEVIAHEAEAAMQTARSSTITDVENNISIT